MCVPKNYDTLTRSRKRSILNLIKAYLTLWYSNAIIFPECVHFIFLKKIISLTQEIFVKKSSVYWRPLCFFKGKLLKQRLANFLWKEPDSKYFRLCTTISSAIVACMQPTHNKWVGCAPRKLYLWTLKFGFKIIFTYHKIVSFFWFFSSVT